MVTKSRTCSYETCFNQSLLPESGWSIAHMFLSGLFMISTSCSWSKHACPWTKLQFARLVVALHHTVWATVPSDGHGHRVGLDIFFTADIIFILSLRIDTLSDTISVKRSLQPFYLIKSVCRD